MISAFFFRNSPISRARGATRTFPVLLALPLSLACAGTAFAGTVSVDPSTVEANRPSTVRLTGQTAECAPIIGHHTVNVSGSVIRLSASIESNPAALCMPGARPYATDFSLPPLPPGRYTVLMSAYPGCAYASAPCPMAVPQPDTGSLTAAEPSASPYAIVPGAVGAGRKSRLRLTGSDFGCGSVFSNLRAEVSGHRIQLSFSHEAHPEALCPAVVGGYGPVFEIGGLAAGVYQVFAAIDPCGKTPCDIRVLSQWAGALEATALPPGKALWIESQTLPPGTPADLVLKGTAFSCNDRLTGKKAEVKNGAIVLGYSLARTEMLCVDTLFIGREGFALPALAAGAYPVILDPSECAFNSFLCPDRGTPKVVDTLYVAAALGLRPAGGKAPTRARAVPGVRIPWRGGEVDLTGRRRPGAEPAP